jgi:hypothetical protein
MPINIAATALLAVLAALLCMPPATVVAAIRWVEEEDGAPRQVSLDARALVVDGTRRLLFAGEMHYTRSTPEVRHAVAWWEKMPQKKCNLYYRQFIFA